MTQNKTHTQQETKTTLTHTYQLNSTQPSSSSSLNGLGDVTVSVELHGDRVVVVVHKDGRRCPCALTWASNTEIPCSLARTTQVGHRHKSSEPDDGPDVMYVDSEDVELVGSQSLTNPTSSGDGRPSFGWERASLTNPTARGDGVAEEDGLGEGLTLRLTLSPRLRFMNVSIGLAEGIPPALDTRRDVLADLVLDR